jgi:hypothetical protein
MTTIPLTDIAHIIRSKNAGPFELTLDVFFSSEEIYRQAKRRQVIDRVLIRRLYAVADKQIQHIVYFDAARSVKVTISRIVSSGAFDDTDVYGAQQHAPLLSVEVPWERP